MTIKINSLENLDYVADNLRDMSDAEAAQIAGGGCDSSSRLYYDEGNYFYETVEVCGTVTTTVTIGGGFATTVVNDTSLGNSTSGTGPAFRTPTGNPQ